MAAPDAPDAPEAPDAPAGAGALRFEQGVVAIVLLAGFVFRVPWVMPVIAVLLLLTMLGPATNVFARAYQLVLRGRTVAPAPAGAISRPAEAPGVTLMTRLVETGLLVLGTLFALIGATGFAWVFGLPVAAITGVAATTHVNVVAWALDVRRRR